MKEGNDKLVFTLLSRKPPTDFENYAVPLSTNTNESKSEEENEVEIEEKSSSTNPKKQKSVSAKPKKTTPPTKKLPNQRKSSQK